MRYYIIFFITLILLIIIFLYKPDNNLGYFKDTVTIYYNEDDLDYNWTYDISNENLILEKSGKNKWTFKSNKDGKVEITFFYMDDKEEFKYKVYYLFEVIGNKIYWLEGESKGLKDYPNPY